MQNHGSVAHGRDIAEACTRLAMVEWHAELYARSVGLGTPRVMTDAELEGVIMAAINMKYGLKKVADEAGAAQ
jgi:L-fuculose-phosphate aldolase